MLELIRLCLIFTLLADRERSDWHPRLIGETDLPLIAIGRVSVMRARAADQARRARSLGARPRQSRD